MGLIVLMESAVYCGIGSHASKNGRSAIGRSEPQLRDKSCDYCIGQKSDVKTLYSEYLVPFYFIPFKLTTLDYCIGLACNFFTEAALLFHTQHTLNMVIPFYIQSSVQLSMFQCSLPRYSGQCPMQ